MKFPCACTMTIKFFLSLDYDADCEVVVGARHASVRISETHDFLGFLREQKSEFTRNWCRKKGFKPIILGLTEYSALCF